MRLLVQTRTALADIPASSCLVLEESPGTTHPQQRSIALRNIAPGQSALRLRRHWLSTATLARPCEWRFQAEPPSPIALRCTPLDARILLCAPGSPVHHPENGTAESAAAIPHSP